MSQSHSHSHDSTHSDARLGGLNLRTYVTGFVLAIILTLIPFAAVAFDLLPLGATLILIAVAAVVQILVHMFFFLHLDFSEENAWNTVSGAFSVLILFILVGGSLWLMWSLEYRTMLMGG